jgi:hypothetical protein
MTSWQSSSRRSGNILGRCRHASCPDAGDIDIDDVAFFSGLSFGMPWQTWWLTEVHNDLG